MVFMLNELLYLVLISFIPGIELRGAIPTGILLYGLNPLLVFFVSTLANIILILPIYIFLGFFFDLIKNLPILKTLIQRIQLKAEKYVEKYGFIGLTVFVAIPLPLTGAYSGVLGAYLLGIKKRKAIPAISLGVLIAGVIVTILSVLALNGFDGIKFLLGI
ncbi:MAG: small multi-drug export protein [Candidatus Diapherotrites archaeon]|nr:small multi-drug export protein [Candidatus Diapherotrites archaeon]